MASLYTWFTLDLPDNQYTCHGVMYDTRSPNQTLAQDIRFYVYAYLNYDKKYYNNVKEKNLKCDQHCS